jgi:hypothetical protein
MVQSHERYPLIHLSPGFLAAFDRPSITPIHLPHGTWAVAAATQRVDHQITDVEFGGARRHDRAMLLTTIQFHGPESLIHVKSGTKLAVPWNVIVDDELPGVLDRTQPSRFAIPESFDGRCRFSVGMVLGPYRDAGLRNVYSQRNGETKIGGYPFGYLTGVLVPGFKNEEFGDNSTSGKIDGPIFRPRPGDFWEIFVSQKSGVELPMDGRERHSIYAQIEWWPA